ncbi:hypothetical protein GF359_01350 [candidate division WOR-3 bacterium]|uniref:T9SS type A sorting domain-containing protein n=1 Tax=candidate division WOR-3 bacterium TaxID=2052148 RepID=A0A9D5K7P6_UNCW3|nr:hypothetical protein [candidate division WOR-3 bacterium]MBD3363841.1 hypothetical protein [candidate division WOR-3 bacterium]
MHKCKVLTILLLVSVLFAEQVSLQTALKVASVQADIMNTRLADAGYLSRDYELSAESLRPILSKEGRTLAYVAGCEPEGFVVVSADDNLVPVIAYAEHGSFQWEENEHNVLMNMLRYDLSKRLELVDLTDAETIHDNHEQWDRFLDAETRTLDDVESWPSAGESWTGGWIQSMWHQSDPYNQFCPMDPETGKRSIVGCVATAMGQIVAFWQYPPSVTFTTEDNYVTRTREIEIHAPDASIDYIDYRNGRPANSTCAAISFACGVGSKMNYTSEASGTYPENSAISLEKHFKYANAESKSEDDADFYEVLEQNMKDAKPAMLWINIEDSSSGGHEIVCDGFREPEYHPEWHLNFGWGSSNPHPLPSAWYILPYGIPYYPFVIEGVVNIEAPSGIDEQPLTDPGIRITVSPELVVKPAEISYHLSDPAEVNVSIYDASGRGVRVLAEGTQAQGEHTVLWDGRDGAGYRLSNGCYFVSLRTPVSYLTKRIVFIK